VLPRPFVFPHLLSSARLSCARNSSSWVAERLRSKRSKMTAIAPCMFPWSLSRYLINIMFEFANLRRTAHF
jgi:hypothetical protein